MTTYVLVHGAFGGSYGFRKVRPLLTAAGHEVLTPSLTGIGERSHLRTPDIDLALHIEDVANMVRCEDVDDIVLLGFSYGGMVVTGCLDRFGDRVRELVYLDAFVPRDGQAATDVLGPVAGEAMKAAATDGYVQPIPRDLGSDEANAWAQERRVGQPILTLTNPVSLAKPQEDWQFGLTYIKATADPAEQRDSAFWQAFDQAVASPAWRTHEIDTNHMIPELRPDVLADILLKL